MVRKAGKEKEKDGSQRMMRLEEWVNVEVAIYK